MLIEDAALEGGVLPIHLLPLDTTTRHTVPYERLVLEEDNAVYRRSYLARLISLFLRKPRAVTNAQAPSHRPFDKSLDDLFEAHDPLAVAHAIFHTDTSQWGTTPREFLVETEGRLTRGFCVVDRRHLSDAFAGRLKTDVEKDMPSANEHGAAAKKSSALDDDNKASGHGAMPSTHVVTQTPGSAWFEDLLLSRLELRA